MKTISCCKKYFIINLVILQFCNYAFISAQDCKSELSIKTNLSSSIIYLNNQYVGKGETTLQVEKGKYIISIRKEKYEWNAKEIADTILIANCGEKKELVYNYSEYIYLNSSPPDAGVFEKDSLIGYTPLNLTSPFTNIELKRKEYSNKIININNLKKDELMHLTFSGKKNGESFLKKDLFKILFGTAVILGGASAYYKLKADENFDKYNQTKLNDYLNKTHEYDLISGIAFGALQLNFGALIYYFLID
ncbi:MAG: PEGA domain-containing protein [Ignavibacteriales bacterium]|nr:PEGA domain-containing protein [Ignavibacteriales bacterium]